MCLVIGTAVKVKKGHPYAGRKGTIQCYSLNKKSVGVLFDPNFNKSDTTQIMKGHLEIIKVK